jgi:hypothetical protein
MTSQNTDLSSWDILNTECFIWMWEPKKRSRYSDWLRAGRPKGRSSSTDRSKILPLHSVQTGSGAHPAEGFLRV